MKTNHHGIPLGWILILLALSAPVFSQSNERDSLDPLSFGVVLDDPAMKQVIVQQDIPYLKDNKGSLHIDLYSPPRLEKDEQRPAIIFLNAIGERAGHDKVKSWGIYSSWPKLMASKGYIGISMETDETRIQESIQALFDFIEKQGNNYHIDGGKLGVYAASANVSQSVNYLMGNKVSPGIRAAVLYYGSTPTGPFRKDLPVFFVISEGDVARNGYAGLWNEVLKNNAPWTIRMGTGMPHAFDAFSDNDESRKIIKETISFWKDRLDPVPVPGFPHSKLRDALGFMRMDPAKALDLLKTLSEEHPKDMRILTFYANGLRESGKSDQAEKIYLQLLGLEPGNLQAMIAIASINYTRGNTAEAEKYIATATSTGKMTAGNYGDLGFTLLVAGKDKEAAIYYEKAVALQPNGHDYYNLACAYAKYGEKDRAFSALGKSYELGYPSKELVEHDEDLILIRKDDRYASFLAKLK